MIFLLFSCRNPMLRMNSNFKRYSSLFLIIQSWESSKIGFSSGDRIEDFCNSSLMLPYLSSFGTADKTETLKKTLYSHALLIVTKSPKSRSQLVNHNSQVKCPSTSSCQVSSDRRASVAFFAEYIFATLYVSVLSTFSKKKIIGS